MASYYEVLGVDEDAGQDEISEAYAAALRAAPTADGGLGATVRKLDEAYAIVGEPERRRRYDELRTAEDGGTNPELIALLSVIAETGRLPTLQEMTGPPVDPEPEPPRAEPASSSPSPEPEPEPEPPSATVPADVRVEQRPAEAHVERRPADVPRRTATAAPPGRVPGTDGGRSRLGRRRTAMAGALVGLLVGAAAGALVADGREDTLLIEEGACVALSQDEGRAVDCAAPEAEAVVTAMTDDPSACEPSPAGHLVLVDGRVACLAPR